jgi:hypothetical protein
LPRRPYLFSGPSSGLLRTSAHAGDVKDIDDPSDCDDAMRAAELHAHLGNAFGEWQNLLRAGSTRFLPSGDGGETLLRTAYELLEPFGATKTLANCLSVMASSSLLAGDLSAAKDLHEKAMAITHQIET